LEKNFQFPLKNTEIFAEKKEVLKFPLFADVNHSNFHGKFDPRKTSRVPNPNPSQVDQSQS